MSGPLLYSTIYIIVLIGVQPLAGQSGYHPPPPHWSAVIAAHRPLNISARSDNYYYNSDYPVFADPAQLTDIMSLSRRHIDRGEIYSWEWIEKKSRLNWKEVPLIELSHLVNGRLLHEFWMISTKEGILYFGK